MRNIPVITKRADFLSANSGLRVARPGFVLLAKANAGLGKRYGITVTKKIGNAVVRNRMKRRFRELLWNALPISGLADHDHILIGREGGLSAIMHKCRRSSRAHWKSCTQAKASTTKTPTRCPQSQVTQQEMKHIFIAMARFWQSGAEPYFAANLPLCTELFSLHN